MSAARASSAAQAEIPLGHVDGGAYRIGRNVAVWKTRADDSHIIDLSFRRRTYKITKESRGPQGRCRLFVNGVRQPDGKLLQGRELTELVRKIDRFHGRLINQLDRIETTMHAGFDRIEKALVQTKWPRLAGKGKLCVIPIAATWPQDRYVPQYAVGGFARVPLPAIQASQEMAAGEYRLLQAILFCAQGTGLLGVGKKRLGRLAKVADTHVKDLLRSLCNRQIIRPTGRILKFGVREYELLTHPWLTIPGLEPIEGGTKNDQRGTKNDSKGDNACPPLKTSNKNPTNKTSEHAPSSRSHQDPDKIDKAVEEQLLGRLSAIVRPSEIIRNPMWRARVKASPKAIIKAIKEYHGLSDENRKQIENPAAWMTKRYGLFGGQSVAKTA